MAMAQYGAPTASTYSWTDLFPYVMSGKLTEAEALAIVTGMATPAQQAKADAIVAADPAATPTTRAIHAKRVEDGTGQGGSGSNPGGGSGTDPTGTGGGSGDDNTGPTGGSTGHFDSNGNWVPDSGSPSGQGGNGTPGGFAVPTGGGVTDAIIKALVPTAGTIASSLINANASGNATAAQQAYLQEALDYEKSRDAAAIALEGNRYSDYGGNIAPYLATGNSANARMTSLLGLPASPSGPSAPPISYQPSATSTGAGAKIGAPTAPVTTGSPLPRVGPASTTTPGTPPGATPPYLPPGPSPMVTMKAPDGSVQQVPANQVSHFQSLGATVVETAA